MENYNEKIYYYDGENYKGMTALVNELIDRGFCGDMEDYEYIMVYVDFVSNEEAEEICNRIRNTYEEINGESGENDNEDFVFDNNEEELL